MIELHGLSAYEHNVSQNSGAKRKKENEGPQFNLNNGGETESSSGNKNVRDVELKTVKEKIVEPETDVETYDFWGKISKNDLLSGINVDIVI